MSGPEKLIDEPQESRGVVCAKCEHLNPRGRNTCGHCGAHLYVLCHSCGNRNPRSVSACTECGRRLHRSLWRRITRRLFERDRKKWALQAIVVVIGILIALALGALFIYFSAVPSPED
jgi:hypothetical protein